MEYVEIGMRIPKNYFETKGRGESDITIHAGSYHLALKDAGIETTNVMTYSSIMPGIAERIEKPNSKDIVHGSVLESIMAVADAKKGQLATAGIIYGWLYDKQTGKRYGGLVCEHNGNYDVEELNHRLKSSIAELYTNGFSEKYDLKNIKIMKESFIPQKKHGTALVALCFTSYVVPVIGEIKK
jgi:arginine decarboxylase